MSGFTVRICLCPGSCPVRVQVRVWFVSRFAPGSCPGRVWLVSGFASGSCLVRVWVRVGFVSGAYLVSVWIRVGFVSGACLVRVRFVSGFVFVFVFGQCLGSCRVSSYLVQNRLYLDNYISRIYLFLSHDLYLILFFNICFVFGIRILL